MSAGYGFSFLINLALTGTLISSIALLICGLMRRRSAASRHLFITATMSGLLLLPLILASGTTFDLALLPPAEVPEAALLRQSARENPPTVSTDIPPELSASNESDIGAATGVITRYPTRSNDFPALAIIVYLVGIGLTLIPIAVGIARLKRNLRSARREEQLGVPLPPSATAVISSSARTPYVWGWARPVLVLPENSSNWQSATFHDVLLHEIAHIERKDGLSQLLGRLALAVHWFNPLVWILMRTLLLDAERACDDRVLEAGTSASDYAERLLSIASHTGRRRFVDEVAAVAMARPTQLVTRIEALLDERGRHWKLSATRVALTIVLVVSAVSATAMVRLERATAVATSPLLADSALSDEPTEQPGPSPWVDIEDNSLTLRAGVSAMIEGKGQIVMSNNRRTLTIPESVSISTGSGTRSPLEFRSRDGKNTWRITPVTSVPATLDGIRITDSDHQTTSVVDSRNGILFYLSIDENGQGVYFEPEESSARRFGNREISGVWNVDDDEDSDEDRDSDNDDPDLDRNDGGDDDESYDARRFTQGNTPLRYVRSISADDSPLYAAVRNDDIRTVSFMLDNGMNPNEAWPGDGNPLIVAVGNGNRELVELLLSRGAIADAGVEGDGNALIQAARDGNLELLKLLVEAGGDIDKGVGGDGNPLIAAAANGEIQVLDYLLDNGADIEKVVLGDENALITASERGQLKAVRYLVARGADVNAAVRAPSWKGDDTEIRTPLSQAIRRGHPQIEAFLRASGARE